MKTDKSNEMNITDIFEKFVFNNARSINIKCRDKAIVMHIKDGEIVTTIYEEGSISKVAFHGSNAIKELICMLEEAGISIWFLLKKLMRVSFLASP
ncbi:Uncharacterised protein [Halioglobus japonicus]|nr:Uncharacterised protein [Halioglobus japonicus]